MSVQYRKRARSFACAIACAAGMGAVAFAPAAGAANLVTGTTYLALGDSLAYGYHAAQFASEYPNVKATNYEENYVNDFAGALKLINPSLQTINLGCPGETSESMIYGPEGEVPTHKAAPSTGTTARVATPAGVHSRTRSCIIRTRTPVAA